MDKLRVNGIRIKSAGSVVQNDKRDMSPMGGDRKSARGLAAEGHVPHIGVVYDGLDCKRSAGAD